MRADTQTLQAEAREVIKNALMSYPHDPRHVAIYVALRQAEWNDVMVGLSRSEMNVSGRRASQINSAVREHLKAELESYLDME